MGKTIPFQVDQQMFCRENAKLPASLDNTKRKAKPVQWGIQQFTMPVSYTHLQEHHRNDTIQVRGGIETEMTDGPDSVQQGRLPL